VQKNLILIPYILNAKFTFTINIVRRLLLTSYSLSVGTVSISQGFRPEAADIYDTRKLNQDPEHW
jgi:hypothetical protein